LIHVNNTNASMFLPCSRSVRGPELKHVLKHKVPVFRYQYTFKLQEYKSIIINGRIMIASLHAYYILVHAYPCTLDGRPVACYAMRLGSRAGGGGTRGGEQQRATRRKRWSIGGRSIKGGRLDA
jgi:hypothetical protein